MKEKLKRDHFYHFLVASLNWLHSYNIYMRCLSSLSLHCCTCGFVPVMISNDTFVGAYG